MSVTFAANQAPVIGFEADCGCPDVTKVKFDSYEDGRMWQEMREVSPYLLDGCTEELCLEYPIHLTALFEGGASPEVNIANGNAVDVFKALGMLIDTPDQDAIDDVFNGGVMDANDFMGRILMAEAVVPVSAERPTVSDTGTRTEFDGHTLVEVETATWIRCGVAEGYVQGRLGQLREVAQWALDNGRPVNWG
jgi:hypothetical protein